MKEAFEITNKFLYKCPDISTCLVTGTFILPASSVDPPLVTARAACVKECHRLVGRPCLPLLEVSTWMRTLRATFLRCLLAQQCGLGVKDVGELLACEIGARP